MKRLINYLLHDDEADGVRRAFFTFLQAAGALLFVNVSGADLTLAESTAIVGVATSGSIVTSILRQGRV